MLKNRPKDIAFEESLSEDWTRDFDIVEVPLGNKSLLWLGIAILCACIIVISQIVLLNLNGKFYAARSEANAVQRERIPAPRGLIMDRNGDILVENAAVFTAVLDAKEFLRDREKQEEAFMALEDILHVDRTELWNSIERASETEFFSPILLSENLSRTEIIDLKSRNISSVIIENNFERKYKNGPVFAPVVGYTGRVNSTDLKSNPELRGEDFIGRAGVESFYDSILRGEPGVVSAARNALGNVLGHEEKRDPKIGNSVRLTIDSGLQEYLYNRLREGLFSLGRKVGIGLALNSQNGEVLALVNIPSFDNNILSGSGRNAEKMEILTSPNKPLFNRAVSGLYNPGSTIKPLVAVAALTEGVIDSTKQIFSPGYLDVPNPYNPDMPTRYMDWRNQGYVDLVSAIGQSSNVYFYTVGGGAGDSKGLGITRLRAWWEKFNLGVQTGIDLSGEGFGFLPSPDWKEKKTKKPWLLGDTYNVSIGQGDLLLTPLQLLSYISAIGNGGKIYRPFVNLDARRPEISADLSNLETAIKEVQAGMRQVVTSPLGTARLLADLPFAVGAKTGTAQIRNNEQANAIFVGYAPVPNPQIALLILVENSKEGSLNTLPIAKDVLNWYYNNRILANSN